ncbi:MAG: MMPL family transporter, partial [Microbacterium sp.]|nr:MMPL family transporter [Microbacterium sp.]
MVPRFLRSLPHVLTSRRGAWVSLIAGVLVLIALMGAFGRVTLDARSGIAPADSESAQVTALEQRFPDADHQALLVVASRDDGDALTESDLQALAALSEPISTETGEDVAGPIPSDDGAAAALQATVSTGDDEAEGAVDGVRDVVAQHPIDGVTMQVTGGPAFGVDVAAAFDGADFTLLLVTILIVALLLIITYRSPVLWLVPLAVVAFADQLASKITAAIGNAMELQFDTGIVSVLVFGAGTNYALLLVSRYREELQRDDDHRSALATAYRATAPAILASNATVVLSLLTLVLAVIPGTRGLGVASAVGLLIALAAVLLVLPPALAVCGRGLFWPFIPRPGRVTREGRAWRGVARSVVRRPWLPLIGGIALLAVMVSGLLGASVGLSQVEKFRVPSESAAGLEVLGEHFPPGLAQPMIVVADTGTSDEVAAAIADVDGVARVTPAGASTDGGLVKLVVTGDAAPGTAASRALIEDVRDAAHGVSDADALVGGQGAADLDARAGNLHDFLVIAPLVLLVALIVLVLLLRALVAPI